MKMKGIILSILAFTVVTASVMVETSEPVDGYHEIETHYSKPVDVPYLDFDLEHLSIIRNYQQTHTKAPEATETPEPEQVTTEAETAETEPLYLGVYTCTAYCSCPACCGEYSSGYTASGTLATEGRTVACNSLPIGTRLLIDGHEYTVEDTGYTPYGDAWIDIFFDSHEAALNFGVQQKEVFLLED